MLSDYSENRSQEMLDFIADLYPFCRSITGDGVRQTLSRIGKEIPLQIDEVPSGSRVFDWIVPQEWNISGAHIEGPDGNRVVDFRHNNLHVMSYSIPVDTVMDLDELKPHLHTLPEQPDLIPYRTSYYSKNWAFCLTHRMYEALLPGEYRVRIDAELSDGHLTLGEFVIPGDTKDEILVYSHVCHPSIANDNLSGLAVSVWWAKSLMQYEKLRHTYRFVWGPGTIGSITWLARNESLLGNIKHGLVTVLLGRPGPIHYKQSRCGNAEIDRIVERVLNARETDFVVREFDPYGYDERQFCSPGINLPVGRLTRAPHGEYPEYHTSGDNLDLIDGDALEEALFVCSEISQELENSEKYRNLVPHGEPQLGRRGLYRNTGGDSPRSREYAMLWLINLSDGDHSLADVADRCGVAIAELREIARDLVDAGVLERL